jgi:hypothetical protein
MFEISRRHGSSHIDKGSGVTPNVQITLAYDTDSIIAEDKNKI